MKRRSFIQGLMCATSLAVVPGVCALGATISNQIKARGVYDHFYLHVHNLVRHTLVQQMIGVDDPETYLDEQSIDRAVDNAMEDFRLPNKLNDRIEIFVNVPAPIDSIPIDLNFTFGR